MKLFQINCVRYMWCWCWIVMYMFMYMRFIDICHRSLLSTLTSAHTHTHMLTYWWENFTLSHGHLSFCWWIGSERNGCDFTECARSCSTSPLLMLDWFLRALTQPLSVSFSLKKKTVCMHVLYDIFKLTGCWSELDRLLTHTCYP